MEKIERILHKSFGENELGEKVLKRKVSTIAKEISEIDNWIDVKDNSKVPDFGWCTVCIDDSIVIPAYFTEDNRFTNQVGTDITEEISKWQPLPNPPKTK